MGMKFFCAICMVTFLAGNSFGQWRVVSDADHRQNLPGLFPKDGKAVKVGDAWPNDQRFRWLVADLEVPESIDGKPTRGKAVGLQFNCGDGGEVYVRGKLQCRYDNDHPALVTLSEKATPSEKVPVAVQVFGVVQGASNLSEARIVLLPDDRVGVVKLSADLGTILEAVPCGLIGLSQGGGMSDYDDSTAAKLKEGGFKWFRMDNVLTSTLKTDEEGKNIYDWSDFDRRLDFIYKIGADPIFAASYMPQEVTRLGRNCVIRLPGMASNEASVSSFGKSGMKRTPVGSSPAQTTPAPMSSRSCTARRSAIRSLTTRSFGDSKLMRKFIERPRVACGVPTLMPRSAAQP